MNTLWQYGLVLLWAAVSCVLVLQALLFLIQLVFAVVGLLGRRVDISTSASAGFASFLGLALSAGLLLALRWLFHTLHTASMSTGESVTFWAIVALEFWFQLEGAINKISKSWRNATIPGSVESDIALQAIASKKGNLQ